MLDAIDERFCDVDNIWEKLKEGAISFYFLPIKDKDLGLSAEELYIKMNSRGKPLTRFEHFKAEFERCIQTVDEKQKNEIAESIDQKWTDLLWRYRDSSNGREEDEVTDDEFLNYFHFICDVIRFRNGESIQGKSSDEFDLIDELFVGDSDKVRGNVEYIKSCFDCWCDIDGFENPKAFLTACFTSSHDGQRVVVDWSNVDIFEDCLHSYTENNRSFTLGRFVLLYAIIIFLRNRENGRIPFDVFLKRLRTIYNLIQNSEDEISDRAENNRIPAILKETDAIILCGQIGGTDDKNYNQIQLHEEIEKKAFLDENPEKTELVYLLEDHPRLKGQIGIIGLDYLDYAYRFVSLFNCDGDLIDCALMSLGEYWQQEGSEWKRYQFASKNINSSWDELFHKSAKKLGFEKTREVLLSLLSKAETFTDEILKQISEDYILSCEEQNAFPWRYYYVKYDDFRPGSYGKYYNPDITATPYLFSVLLTKTKWSPNTFNPFLKVVDESHLSKEWYGQRLVYDDKHIVCDNNAYLLCKNENEGLNDSTPLVIESIPIQQNEQGVDMEDRVLLLKHYLDEKMINQTD